MPEADFRQAMLDMGPELWKKILSDREWEDLTMGHRVRVTDLENPAVASLPEVLPTLFADAAHRTLLAGFDGVELHFAHAYTMASFLSGRNTRSDGYGGDLSGRLRLPLRVLRAVRRRIGEDACVGVRYLADECIGEGYEKEEAAAIALALAKGGANFLSLSRGGKFEDARQPKVGAAAYPYTGPSGQECMPTIRIGGVGPFGRNVPLSEFIRRQLHLKGHRVPIVVAGGIWEFDQAEEILAQGQADVVAAARQSLADPDWWLKMRLGRGAEIRRCLFTNYCEGLDQAHKEVTCQLWDKKPALDPSEKRSADGRRRLIAPAWSWRKNQEPKQEGAGGSL
jgi:2,4-dienoyl-CoA reductase-like NADH-dependent reductase (Old Yellow Enzyme family)